MCSNCAAKMSFKTKACDQPLADLFNNITAYFETDNSQCICKNKYHQHFVLYLPEHLVVQQDPEDPLVLGHLAHPTDTRKIDTNAAQRLLRVKVNALLRD